MAEHVFITGFPGFIARRLLANLAERLPDRLFTLLVEERLLRAASAAIQELDTNGRALADRVTLVSGDITAPRLGLTDDTYRQATRETSQVWHLAAIYDLSVPESVAYRVNVLGTANVLDLCANCSSLQRLDYVSTCYVSGTRKGLVLESELDEGQSFNNHYESSKCRAEMEVRRRMDRIPTAIHRPGIVVGDSKTGLTDKYDGPYFVLKLLMRLPSWTPVPHIGAGDTKVNMVPVDFLVDAMTEIGSREECIGSTYHLTDPNPRSARDVVLAFMDALGRARPRFAVPSSALSVALKARRVREWIKIPQEAAVYFSHSASYDTTNQLRVLANTGLACPDFLAYAPRLVEYVRANPEKSFLDGRAY